MPSKRSKQTDQKRFAAAERDNKVKRVLTQGNVIDAALTLAENVLRDTILDFGGKPMWNRVSHEAERKHVSVFEYLDKLG